MEMHAPEVPCSTLTLTLVRLTAAAVGRPPGSVVIEGGTPLAVIPFSVMNTQTLSKYLEGT